MRADGVAVAYGSAVWRGPDAVWLEHYVRAGWEQDAGIPVLDQLLATVDREADARGTRPGVTLGQAVDGPFTPLLRTAGWAAVRRFSRMTRDLTAEDSAAVPLPPGLVLRNLEGASEVDIRSWHAVKSAAFAEHWGSVPEPFPTWRARIEVTRGLDWSLWWLAAIDGLDVGIVAAHVPGPQDAAGSDAAPDVGWLGVLREARGRGVARALLRTSFGQLAGRGHRRVGLSVDSANTTNAVALYTGLGMSVEWAADVHERPPR